MRRSSRCRWWPGSTTCGSSRSLYPPGRCVQLDLFDVEAEIVQAVQPLVDLVPLVGAERLLARQLVPERGVARDDLFSRLVRVEIRRQSDLGVDVEQLADDVRLRDVQVVCPLPVGELPVQFARLRVDEVGGERAGVAAEERVRQRAVAPEEAADVEPSEQLRERVQEVRAQVGDRRAGEEGAVGERVLEVLRDQDRVEIRAARRHDSDRFDDRQSLSLEAAEQRPLTARGPFRQLLERVEVAVVLDEPHDVAADAADQVDEARRVPLLERRVPGQVEEARVPRARDQLEVRRHQSLLDRAEVERADAAGTRDHRVVVHLASA